MKRHGERQCGGADRHLLHKRVSVAIGISSLSGECSNHSAKGCTNDSNQREHRNHHLRRPRHEASMRRDDVIVGAGSFKGLTGTHERSFAESDNLSDSMPDILSDNL
jgi:hypothetical protein